MPDTPSPTGNLFLDSLPAASVETLRPMLVLTDGQAGKMLAHAGMPIQHAVFPIASVLSAVTRMQDGTDVEVMVIGREGFYGLQLALGSETSGDEVMVQIADAYWRMSSSNFVKCLSADPVLMRRALSYTQVMLETISQFSACNRLHPVNERCARWLLMAHDRVVGDTLFLTHEYLATMLGVRRPSVSLAAAALDEAGLIEYHRGRIFIRNRPGLEHAACECYANASDSLERLLNYNVRKRPTRKPSE